MRNIFFIATLLLTLCAFNTNAQDAKIAHVNYLEVIDSLPSKLLADKEIQKFLEDGQKTITDMEIELETQINTYLEEKETLSVIMQELREKQIQEQSQIIELKRQTLQQDLEILNARMYDPIETNLKKAIDLVAERHNVTYVIDESMLLYVNGGLDLTEEVKAEMLKMETGG
ncbi:MAG: OmpH family outer membrane protein [Crocinitomicaceae bacterium]|nr:OmpH family outer membrane protein [Crocinitomicaceae bacterium]